MIPDFKSLNRKIAVAVLGVAISFAVVIAAISFMTELSRSRSKTEVMINQLLDTVEYSAAIATYTNNQQIAEDVINGLIRNDIVHKIYIHGDQGLSLKKERNTQAGNGIDIIRKLPSPFDSQQTIGIIVVSSEAYYSLEEAKHSALINAINSIFLIGLTTVLILIVVRNRLAQPLTVVSNTLHAISAGEQNRIVPLSTHGNDELGRLVVDINKLLDVLETKFANEQSLREKVERIEKQLRDMFESSSAGLFQLDQEGRVLSCNPNLAKVLNNYELSDHEVIGKDFAELFFNHPENFRTMLCKAIESGQLEAKDFSLKLRPRQNPLWIHCLLSKIANADGHDRFEGVVFDITPRVVAEQITRHEAEYDALTGLLRRSAAEVKLQSLIAIPLKFPLAVMLLDLDGFKAVNDTHGHNAGDKVLIETAVRLKNSVRSQDILARLGGDEFMIVLNQCETADVEATVAKKIIEAIQQPIMLTAHISVTIGVSIGIASYPIHGADIASLLKAADEAMYDVKRNGKNNFAVKQG